MKTKHRLLLAAYVAIFSLGFIGFAWDLPDAGMSLPPCPAEDSYLPGGCSWDASERGEGRGLDFWVVEDSQAGLCYTYPGHSEKNVCLPTR